MIRNSILFLCLCVIPVLADSGNLLKNPGFETGGYWHAYLHAYVHNEWRSHDGGRYNAAIMGQWAGRGPLSVIDRERWADQSPGGMIQQRDIPVEPGYLYNFRAWLWADPGWAPMEQYMLIKFYDAEGFILKEQRCVLPVLYAMWQQEQCLAIAPPRASTASVAIGAAGVSLYGALTIDDLYFGPE